MSGRCSVCANPGVRKVIDGYLEEGVSGAGISRSLGELGLGVTPEVINRHKQHYQPPATRQPGTRKLDFAVAVRDKAFGLLEGDQLDLRDKELVPGINAGLKAQAVIDKREVAAKKQTQAAILVALLAALEGREMPDLPLLGDGQTIEGEYERLDGDEED